MENAAVSRAAIPDSSIAGFSRRKLWNQGARCLIWASAIFTCLLLAFIIGYIFYRGVPYLSWELLTSQSSYVKKTIGIGNVAESAALAEAGQRGRIALGKTKYEKVTVALVWQRLQ